MSGNKKDEKFDETKTQSAVKSPVRIGTRPSVLAKKQAQNFADAFAEASGMETRLIEIASEGDKNTHDSLKNLGGNGVFVAALEKALHNGEVDIAVHSLKDLPVEGPADLTIVTIPEREDPRDALIIGGAAQGSGALEKISPHAVIGTGSPRRITQLQSILAELGREDVQFQDIRGNLETRLHKVKEGQIAGIVLAAAGLNRLGLEEEISYIFEPSQMMPAAGQGALAIQTRTELLNEIVSAQYPGQQWQSPTLGGTPSGYEDPFLRALTELDDKAARLAVTAERSVLARLEAGCSSPIGALAAADVDNIIIHAVGARQKAGDDSPHIIHAQSQAQDLKHFRINDAGAALVGINAAEQLLYQGFCA